MKTILSFRCSRFFSLAIGFGLVLAKQSGHALVPAIRTRERKPELPFRHLLVCDLALNVSLNDISLPAAPTHPPAIQPPEVVFHVMANSLGVVDCVMTWALPLSSMLAINLFRVSLVLWLLLAFRPGATWKRSPIFLPMLCFLALTALASMLSLDRVASWQQMKTVELAFAALIVSDTSARVLRWMVGGLLTTSFAIAVVAAWQYLHRVDAFTRIQGLYRHYVNFGEMLLLVAALSFGVALGVDRSHIKMRVGAGVVFVATTAALVATATRTFLAALLLACFYIVWQQFRWRTRAFAAVAVAMALIVGAWWFHSRRGFSWFDLADPGTQYRLLIWRDAGRIIRQHPLFGVGLASVQRHPDRFHMSAYSAFPNMISHFHSTPIEIAADCGLPALVVWIWLMFTCWSTARRALAHTAQDDSFVQGIALGVLAAVVAFQFASLFHYILGDPEPMLLFWILIGAAIILERRTSSRTDELLRSSTVRPLATPPVSS
jgi:O-antigen ligase